MQQGFFDGLAAAGDFGGIAMLVINFGTTLSFVKYSLILFGAPNATRPLKRDPWVATISLLFGITILAGGLFGGPAVGFVYGPQYSAAGALATGKVLTFILTLGVAVGTYFAVVRRIGGFLAAIRRFKFSFNQITVFLTLFFVGLLGYVWWAS